MTLQYEIENPLFIRLDSIQLSVRLTMTHRLKCVVDDGLFVSLYGVLLTS